MAAAYCVSGSVRRVRIAYDTQYAIRDTRSGSRAGLLIRDTQYAIRDPAHELAAGAPKYTIRKRNAQPCSQGSSLPAHTQTLYAIRSPPQVSLLFRNTQYANTMRNAQSASSLSRARSPQHTNAIRDTQWPPRAAFFCWKCAQYAIRDVYLDPQRPQQHPRSPSPYAIQPLHTQYLHTQRMT